MSKSFTPPVLEGVDEKERSPKKRGYPSSELEARRERSREEMTRQTMTGRCSRCTWSQRGVAADIVRAYTQHADRCRPA